MLVSNVSVAPVSPPHPSPVLSLVEFPQGGAGRRDPEGRDLWGSRAELRGSYQNDLGSSCWDQPKLRKDEELRVTPAAGTAAQHRQVPKSALSAALAGQSEGV